MMNKWSWSILFWVQILIASSALAGEQQEPSVFERPQLIEPNIQFWTKVYGVWSVNQIAFHDQDDLSYVYCVIDVPPLTTQANRKSRQMQIEATRDELKQVLQNLDATRPTSADGLSGLERDVYLALLPIVDANKYQKWDTIRAQNGLKERFEEGLLRSGLHADAIKQRLKEEGLPEDLIGIVFVESLFFPTSKSHAGAAGIWQFVHGTAKEFMQVNNLVDERFDPLISTNAAIAYFKSAQRMLQKNWALVITSYNYGRAGTLRAAERVGALDYERVLTEFEHNRFGFAARNYYSEFLAALDVYKNADMYFPNVGRWEQWKYDVATLSKPIYFTDLARASFLDSDWLREYNPALQPRVLSGHEVLPQGFSLRVPKGLKSRVESYASELPTRVAARHVRARHRANGRQKVIELARLNDSKHDKLSKRLGRASHKRAKRGTVIVVRSSDSRFTTVPSPLAQGDSN